MEKVLVTGSAGFIGFHITKLLLSKGFQVLAIDNLNDYYDVNLKHARLNQLGINFNHGEFASNNSLLSFRKLDLENHNLVVEQFQEFKPNYVVHLAAQAGVRYSLSNPRVYTQSNIEGFLSILEGCRKVQPNHLVFASSSSVYGLNQSYPFGEDEFTDHAMSLYAATKRANEIMAHSYSHLYKIPATGLRFFTAYGPWGRPDMALYIFVKNILEEKSISVYNQGEMLRDFTYVDDLVQGIFLTMLKRPNPNNNFNHKAPIPSESSAPYRILNIGNNSPVRLLDFIKAIEIALNKKAIINFEPLQPGDVTKTYANVSKLQELTGYSPNTHIQQGVNKFIEWYKFYYKI